MSSRVCSQCGCSDIDKDSARGDAVCTGCGSVLEDQIIVSEIQFQESAGGASSMVGQFVSTDGPKSLSLGGTFRGGIQKESRTITLQNGKKRIQQLAAQMKLNQMCIDRAFNFFKMAVSRRITRGRKSPHVVAACLYLVCRTERTPHMLLDFSDVLQVNVYTLGKTYMSLAKELCINMPEIDPCLYIPRFAHALEFGEKTHDVSMTAMRLVQRMKRDWMHTGRRPSGLCGAALLVAARIHDFSRSVKEVIRVVKVCQTTLKKRLNEFEETPSSQLTIEEFHTIDLEEEHDPPCFTEGKRKLAMAKKLQEQTPEQLDEVSRIQDEIEETLKKYKPRGIWAAYSKMPDDSMSVDSDTSRFSDVIDPEASCDSGKAISATGSTDSNLKIDSNIETNLNVTSVNNSKLDISGEINVEIIVEPGGLSNTTNKADRDNLDSGISVAFSEDSLTGHSTETSAIGGEPDESNNISAITTEMIVGSKDLVASGDSSLKLPVKEGLSVQSVDIGVDDIVSDILKEGSDNSNDGVKNTEENEEQELDLEGLDDGELDKFILSEKEVKVKTRIWMAENADYLKAQKEKEERKAREAEEEAKKNPDKKKRTHKKKPKVPYQEAQTAQEAIQKIIQEKKISSKINYDVLNDLTFNASTVKSSSIKGDNPGEVAAVSAAAAIHTVGPILENRASTLLRLKKVNSGAHLEEPAKKQQKLSPSFLPEVQAAKQEIVVESGPVQYLQKDEGYEDEEEIEDYDEEDVTHLSAAQLLGHTGKEEDYYEDME